MAVPRQREKQAREGEEEEEETRVFSKELEPFAQSTGAAASPLVLAPGERSGGTKCLGETPIRRIARPQIPPVALGQKPAEDGGCPGGDERHWLSRAAPGTGISRRV